MQAPYHSQSLNRYAYVWNNPTTFVDPSGFQSTADEEEEEEEERGWGCRWICPRFDIVGAQDTAGFTFAPERNIRLYGDARGPSIDWLRSQGKSWEQIIESAKRPGGGDLGF